MEQWKYKAIDKLRDYRLQKAALESIPHEIKRLELESTSIRSATADGSPVKGGGNGREERMLWNIMQRDEMERNRMMAAEAVDFVESGLKVLNETERRAVERMYIYQELDAAERLRNEWNLKDRDSVSKRMGKILYKLTMAMYGVMQS